MKKLLLTAMALIFVVSVASSAQAQILRVGGGVITSGSQPGGGIGVDFKLADKPFAFNFTGEYFTKSGNATVPVGVSALYHKTAENGKATVFFGGGGGIAYTTSTTNAMGTAQGGVIFHASPKVGIFAKAQYYSVFSSPGWNIFSVTGGVSFTLMPLN